MSGVLRALEGYSLIPLPTQSQIAQHDTTFQLTQGHDWCDAMLSEQAKLPPPETTVNLHIEIHVQCMCDMHILFTCSVFSYLYNYYGIFPHLELLQTAFDLPNFLPVNFQPSIFRPPKIHGIQQNERNKTNRSTK